MSFPESVDTVTLTCGPVLDADGNPRAGVKLYAIPAHHVFIAETKLRPGILSAATGADGTASLEVIATDSAGLINAAGATVTSFRYRIGLDDISTASSEREVYLPKAHTSVAYEDLVANTAAITPAGLSSTFAPVIRDQSEIAAPTAVVSKGNVLSEGTNGDPDYGYVESPCVFYDHETGKLGMIYTGYSLAIGNGSTVASHCIARSDDGITWTKGGQFFTASGDVGAPDRYGVTGPVILYEDGLWYLFYIGLTAVGYEGGTPSICLATATTLAGPWTRHGQMVAPSGVDGQFHKTKTYHPNIVRVGATWYMFFNAHDGTIERAGYATATSLTGPWTVDTTNSPLLPDTGHTTDKVWGGDPFVWWTGDHWRMDFFSADSGYNPIGNWYATTDSESFPLGWKIGAQTTVNASGGIKPWIIRWGGQVYHYTTRSGICLNIITGPTERTADVTGLWSFDAPRANTSDASAYVGDTAVRVQTSAAAAAKLVVGRAAANSEIILTQADVRGLLLQWVYNATASSASGKIETYGGSNPLNIQVNNGKLNLAGSGGYLGFHGATAVQKQTVTGAKDSNAALGSLITALANLGLITDSTSA